MSPIGQQFFGDASIAALLSHEYGHAVQVMAKLVDEDTPTLVWEQQADCLAGTYSRWVAEGRSPLRAEHRGRSQSRSGRRAHAPGPHLRAG